MSTGTLFEALQSIPDYRTKKGRRFPLAAILAIAIAAMLSGASENGALYAWLWPHEMNGPVLEPVR